MFRLVSLFSRRRRYDDLAVSIQEHIQDKIDELVDDGMTPAEAERRASVAPMDALRSE